MSGLKKIFCAHPASVNETYFEHCWFACRFGLRMIFGGLACIVHGFFPFLCVRTGSRSVCELHDTLRSSGRPVTTSIDPKHVPQV